MDSVIPTLFVSLLIHNFAVDFISHSTETLTAEHISAITSLVGNTATRFVQRDQLQPLQLYCGSITFDSTGKGTTTDVKSRKASRATSAASDAIR